jgi:hypothetical protein
MPTLEAAPTDGTIRVDGRLDESGWASAPAAQDFRQLSPNEGTEPSQHTAVHVLYGPDALYVGARLHDEQPSRIQDRLTRRDERNQADWFEVSLDSYFDRKTARTFAVNAAGVQRDGIVRGRRLDESWDGVWTSAVRVTATGWTAELRIPYSMLRFNEAESQTWGVQFVRRIPRTSEVLEWSLVPSTERSSGVVAQYGRLTGLRTLNPARNVQVAPYTVGRLETEEDAAAPGTMQAEAGYDLGGDFEMSLGPSMTLNATVNPDFGQVESDPAVLNLSAFETFFSERRPFFVEGADVFDFSLGGGSELLYTRRIGGSAPVIGASKITGRTSNGLSFGVLGATTGDAFEPARGYGAARVRQDIGTYSTAGGMLTTFTGPGGPNGHRRTLTGGADWDLRFQDNTYQVEGFVASTHRTSTAPGVDSETGLSAEAQAGRAQGAWTYELGTRFVGPAFDPNDTGRQRQNNFFRVSGELDHQINDGKSFGPFQSVSLFSFTGQSWSVREGLSRGFGFFLGANFDTNNFREFRIRTNGDYLFGGYDLFETRGLGPRAQPRVLSARVSVETDSRRSWQLEPGGDVEAHGDGGLEYGASLEAEWTASEHLSLRGEVEYNVDTDVTDWASNETFRRASDGTWAIGTEGAPPDALDDGDFHPLDRGHDRLDAIAASVRPTTNRHYYLPVFGARDTRRFNATLRSTVTLTTDLSIELFSQLFAARGRYDRFQLLQTRDDLADFDAYPKRHDFASYSFIGNTVLRWEFQPGSELFLVWSQSRRANPDDPFFAGQQPSPFEPPTRERLLDTFSVFPQNAFILKVRYLLY